MVGECIDNASSCEVIGGISRVSLFDFQGVESLVESHLNIDNSSKVFGCYWGYNEGAIRSYFFHQMNVQSFDEIALTQDSGEPVRCGAAAILSDSTPIVLSRKVPSILWLQDDKWKSIPLPELQGLEAQGAMLGDNISVQLVPDTENGLYLAMSIGFDVGAQAIYIAYWKNGEVSVLKNGWNEDGNHTFYGHSPQIVLSNQDNQFIFSGILYFDPFTYSIKYVDSEFRLMGQQEGIFAAASQFDFLPMQTILMDRNRQLSIGEITQASFTLSEQTISYNYEEASNGQTPWQIDVDKKHQIHVLSYEPWRGKSILTYFQLNDQTGMNSQQIVTEQFAGDLPGGQFTAIRMDMCDRPTIAFVKQNEKTEDEDEVGSPFVSYSIEILEGI